MAYDEDQLRALHDALAGLEGVTEKRMFGGVCLMLNGNMLCGAGKEMGMARVGKAHEAEALQIEGVAPLSFTKRRMGGMVDLLPEIFEDDAALRQVLHLAVDFVGSLPQK